MLRHLTPQVGSGRVSHLGFHIMVDDGKMMRYFVFSGMHLNSLDDTFDIVF